jgi:hypothetical protein
MVVIRPELYKLLDPGPLVPSHRSYAVTPFPAVHVNTTLEVPSVDPVVGVIIIPGLGVPVVKVTVTMLDVEAG